MSDTPQAPPCSPPAAFTDHCRQRLSLRAAPVRRNTPDPYARIRTTLRPARRPQKRIYESKCNSNRPSKPLNAAPTSKSSKDALNGQGREPTPGRRIRSARPPEKNTLPTATNPPWPAAAPTILTD